MRRTGAAEGSALVESAIVLPVFVLLVLCAIQLALLGRARLLVEFAAYRAARGHPLERRSAAHAGGGHPRAGLHRLPNPHSLRPSPLRTLPGRRGPIGPAGALRRSPPRLPRGPRPHPLAPLAEPPPPLRPRRRGTRFRSLWPG